MKKITIAQGAKILGVTRQALSYRVEKHNLKVSSFDVIGEWVKGTFYIDKSDLKLFKFRKKNGYNKK